MLSWPRGLPLEVFIGCMAITALLKLISRMAIMVLGRMMFLKAFGAVLEVFGGMMFLDLVAGVVIYVPHSLVQDVRTGNATTYERP